MRFVCFLLGLYVLVVFARVVVSWFPIQPGTVLATVVRVLFDLTEPVLGPLRRIMPPVGMIDLSPVVLTVGLLVLQRAVCP